MSRRTPTINIKATVICITLVLTIVLLGLRELVTGPIDPKMYREAMQGGLPEHDERIIVHKLILEPLGGGDEETTTTSSPNPATTTTPSPQKGVVGFANMRKNDGGDEEYEKKHTKHDAEEEVVAATAPLFGKEGETTVITTGDVDEPIRCASTPLGALKHIQSLVEREHALGLEDRISPNQCKQHFDEVLDKLGRRSEATATHCTATYRRLLKPVNSVACAPAGIGGMRSENRRTTTDEEGGEEILHREKPPVALNLFIDLGSRTIDQTSQFAVRYPKASTYITHCFEANPAFNKLYPSFITKNAANGRRGSQYKLLEMAYHNKAAGVMNTTLFLSDKDVGSSIVSEKKKKDTTGEDSAGTKDKKKESGVHVSVVSLARFISEEVGGRLAQALRHKGCRGEVHSSHVVLKMDIEKMEFAVLNQMIRTGTLALVDDLLLECHFNTNKVRSQRNLEVDLGKDDCKDLVQRLNTYLNGGGVGGTPMTSRPFITVLWNSAKTAKASRYSELHGGFYPT